jgi:hypothetical protein
MYGIPRNIFNEVQDKKKQKSISVFLRNHHQNMKHLVKSLFAVFPT